MIGRRMGRPGLLGTVARTAVIAGTARATTNAMDRSSQRRAAEQQAYADQQAAEQQAAMAQQFAAQQQTAPPAAAPSGSSGDDLIAKLQQLGQLHQSGVLSDEEFAAAKAKLLA
ncbi:SHOCT domain-containing protein [Prescottella agglutinans]|uniref:SHOCT domain-containing protein n=1 Tax=Prescottella agglutinans TaxID=1644129 RepID=A0A438B8H7_9NOCA|nr:SHOCT domain-containing protein [Prescottella agglutinans]RVW07276.1 SHOCT domain-containing protein [Prescottella agglutinans]